MQTRSLLLLSLVGNAALLGAMGYHVTSRPVLAPAAGAAAPSSPAIKRPAPQRVMIPSVGSAKPDIFNWRMVEAEDYKKYIANLRFIGCPEETIRDIIVADVNKLYAQKLAPAMATARKAARDFKFWQASSRGGVMSDFTRQMRSLDREKWALLKDLLGSDVEGEYRRSIGDAELLQEELSLGFLPEAKRAQVNEIIERYKTLEQEIQQRTSGGALSMKDRTELKRVRDQRQAELAQLLTPQELEEYELRNSSSASALRNRFASVPLTEDQFRQIFRMQKSFDDEFGSPGAGFSKLDRGGMEKRMTAQRQLDEGVKSVLGDSVYEDYRRNQDLAYRGLMDVARDYSLSADTVNKVYEMKKAVDESVRKLIADTTMPRDERMTALQGIAQETEKAMLATLGQQAFDAYKQNGGFWVPNANGGSFVYSTSGPGGDAVQTFKFSTSSVGEGAAVPGGASGSGSGSTKILVLPRTSP
jgi:hypothetical protein